MRSTFGPGAPAVSGSRIPGGKPLGKPEPTAPKISLPADAQVITIKPPIVVRELAEHLWYPLWDAGFVLGHTMNTVKQEVALAERDLDALTALLDARLVTGDSGLFGDRQRHDGLGHRRGLGLRRLG